MTLRLRARPCPVVRARARARARAGVSARARAISHPHLSPKPRPNPDPNPNPTCRLLRGLHPGERVVQVGGEAGDDLGRCRRPCGRRTGEIALLAQSMQLKHVRTGRLNRPDHGSRHAKHGCVDIRGEVVRRSGAQQCAELIDNLT